MKCCRISLIFLGIVSAIVIGVVAEGQETGSFIEQLQNKKEIVEVRRKAAYALGQIGDPAAITVLVQSLKDERGEVRAAAASALVRMGSLTVPELIRSLNSKDAVVRSTAAYALGRIGEPNAIPALVQLLNDERWEVRQNAASALGKIDQSSQTVVFTLIQGLSDKHINVRISAASMLGQIGAPAEAAIPGLAYALNHQQVTLRGTAAKALGQIGVPTRTAVAALINVLNDESPWVRANAAYALGQVDNSKHEMATRVLTEVLSCKVTGVRLYAARALAAMDDISQPRFYRDSKQPAVIEIARKE